uniref:Uncharacterized protein n=1 Tax=Rhizophora mucronata TaxID=61149 RepID=A0A2P2L620_RHIMU
MVKRYNFFCEENENYCRILKKLLVGLGWLMCCFDNYCSGF